MSIEKIILIIIASIIQSFAATIMIFKQIPTKNMKIKIRFFSVMNLYSILVSIFAPNNIRFLLFVIAILLLLYFVIKIKERKIILYAFNTIVLFAISEILVSFVFVILGFNSKLLINNIFYNFVANLFISFFSIILICIPFIKKIIFNVINLFDKNKKLFNYLCIFIFTLYLIILKNGLEFLLKSNYYINVLFIIGIVLIILIIIKSEYKYEQINEQNKQMLNYVKKYERIITEQGKANHEFKNQLMVIRGYAQMNSSKLIEYLDSIVDDTRKTHSSYLISQLNRFPDGGIKGLLYYKLSLMDDFKIKYDINVESGVKTKLNSLSTDMYKNITKILGVLLDNAIDASKQTKTKKIVISVIKEKSIVVFNIYNTYKGKLDISKIGTGYTTKGNGHGYGLRLVNDIINNNKYFKIENLLEDEYYICKLSIKIINKRKNKGPR